MTRLEQNTRAFGLEEVPTFHPTAEEFQDPLSYIEKISSEGSKYGMVKISPPSDYKPEFALDTEEFRFTTRIQKLNRIDICDTIQFLRRLTRYHRINKKHVKIPPLEKKWIDLYQLKQAVANRGGLDSVDQDKKWNEIGLNLGHAAKNLHGMANTLRTAYVNIILPFEIWEARHKDVDLFELQEISETEVDENKACEVCADIKDEANMMLCDGCCGAYHIYCLSPPLKNVPKTDWFCQSCLEVVKNKVESRCYNLSEFEDRSERFKREWFQSPKVPVDECECEFWKLVKSKETFEVEYGLGLHGTEHGSGFKRPEDFSLDTFDPWNLNVIPASQKSLFTHVKSDNHQLMTPWIYVGMCFSALCWKIEQHSTYSISYLHWGDPKTWYSVPKSNIKKFEKVVRKVESDLLHFQPDLLLQSITMLSPEILIKERVKVYAVDQRPGQFVVTFPNVYHAGFNHGFNFCESVNFAPIDWIDDGLASVKLYKEHKKSPCFSHDELLVTAVQDLKRNLKSNTKWLVSALAEMCERELLERKRIRNYKMAGEVLMLGVNQKRELQCDFCHCYTYLSFTECVCKKIACSDHITDLCVCSQASKTRYIRFTDEKLCLLVQEVIENSYTPDKWIKRLDEFMNKNPTVKGMKELYEEGHQVGVALEILDNLEDFIRVVEDWIIKAEDVLDPKRERTDMSRIERIQYLIEEAKTISFNFNQIPLLKDYLEKLETYDAAIALLLDIDDDREEQERVRDKGIRLGADSKLFKKLQHTINYSTWLVEAKDALSKPVDFKRFKYLIKQGRDMDMGRDAWFESLVIVRKEAKKSVQYIENLCEGKEKIYWGHEDCLENLGENTETPQWSYRLEPSLMDQLYVVIERSKIIMEQVEELMCNNSGSLERPSAPRGFYLMTKCKAAALKSDATERMADALSRVSEWHQQLIDLFNVDFDKTIESKIKHMLKRMKHLLTHCDTPGLYCICRRRMEGLMVECEVCNEKFHNVCMSISSTRSQLNATYVCPICEGISDKPAFGDIEDMLVSARSLFFTPNNYAALEEIYNHLIQFKTVVHAFFNRDSKPSDVRRYLLCMEGLGVDLPVETNILREKLGMPLTQDSSLGTRSPSIRSPSLEYESIGSPDLGFSSLGFDSIGTKTPTRIKLTVRPPVNSKKRSHSPESGRQQKK